MTRYSYVDSPIGALLVAGDATALRLISFPSGDRAKEPQADWEHDPEAFREVARQLDDYFAGTRTTFELPLAPEGTAFQKAVWRALLDIPYGETTSYGALAARIGRPQASRAVGAANGANPLPVVVPCHRVIGADRSLTGFGGGLDTKRYLLAHEQRHTASAGDLFA